MRQDQLTGALGSNGDDERRAIGYRHFAGMLDLNAVDSLIPPSILAGLKESHKPSDDSYEQLIQFLEEQTPQLTDNHEALTEHNDKSS